MKSCRFLALSLSLAALPVAATELSVKIELPQVPVAEYHRPYVAMWLERVDQPAPITHLMVWYAQKKKDNGGAKWLKDMRQWWRKGGRELEVPVDAITSATRAPGAHTLTYVAGQAPLDGLASGDYVLQVEAARESGGREVLKLPLRWPPRSAQTVSAQGAEELGAVSVQLKP